MIKIYNKPLLLLILLIVSFVTIISCKKDDTVNSGQIQLLSFGPTGAKNGDTIKFIGNNLNQVTEIDFTGTGAVVAQSAFIQQSSEVIMVVVPQSAEQGFVTLKTSQGNIVSKSRLNLNVAATISSMTAEARPGENITINGQYLNWVRRVTFANDKVVDTFVSQAIDKLVVKVPMDAQTGPLTIFYGGTDSMDIQTADTFKVTLPAITSMAPNPVKHADNLTITGTNLDLVKEILFKGDTTHIKTFVSQSAGEIVVTVSASASKGKLSLIAPSGVSVQSADDADVVLPAVTFMNPNPVDAEANLTITGSNLDLVTSISFVGVTNPVTTFVSQSANSLTVKVPAGSLKGKLVFSVKNSTLTVESGQDLVLNGGLPPLADFQFPIYTDALENGFQDWSYTDIHDFNSTANVRQGTRSIKAVYNAANGYQGLTFHNPTPASTSGYTKLEFSVFGEAGTGDKKLNVVVNGNYGSPAQVTIKEGEWATFSLNLSSIGASATLGEIVLQSAGFGGTVHIDHVGLR